MSLGSLGSTTSSKNNQLDLVSHPTVPKLGTESGSSSSSICIFRCSLSFKMTFFKGLGFLVFPTSLSLPRFSNGADESNMLPGKLKDALQTVTCSFFGAIEAVCCGLVKVELVGATGFFYKKKTTHRML